MIQSMKAIIIKETRENARWAGLIFLITSGLLARGLYAQFNTGMSILERTFLDLCMLIYPGAGLFLGLAQVFQDSRQGRWQFITHRPISRSRLLAGKVLVGLTLYLAATLTPLAAIILWVSAPDHVPGPFSWDMTEPALAYLLMGTIMWYAAGLLMAARKAQWIGSRIMPLGGALAGTLVCALFAITLMQAIAIIVACTALILIAAWGAFIASGETSRAPGWSKPAMGLTVVIGWIFVIALGMALGDGAIGMVSTPGEITYQRYHLTRNGEIRIWTIGRAVIKIQDLSGRTSDDRLSRTGLASARLFFSEDSRAERSWIFRNPGEAFFRPEIHAIGLNYPNWFYLVRGRTVQGYDQKTHEYLGSLGPNGFSGPEMTPQPFPQQLTQLIPINLRNSYGLNLPGLFAFPDAVYKVDIPQRQVERLFTSAAGDPVITADYLPIDEEPGAPESQEPKSRFVVVATETSLHILQGDRSLMALPIEYDYLKPWREAIVGRTASGQFVVAYGTDESVGYAPATVSIYRPDGTLIRRTDLPLLQKPSDNKSNRWREIAFLTLVPQSICALVAAGKSHFGAPVPSDVIAILLLSAAGYAAISFAMLRARHAGRRQVYIWVLLAATLGLSGILLLVSMLDNVRSIRCASCGKRRLVTEATCPHCRAPAAPPVMLGIEIFEPDPDQVVENGVAYAITGEA